MGQHVALQRGGGGMTTYDEWKTTNPADGELGDGPIAPCDCCGKVRPLTRCWPFGTETWACDECREPDPDEARERQRDDALWDGDK